MKTYSDEAKTASAVISIIISYFLVIVRFQYISPITENILDFNVAMWEIIEFCGALLCIIAPVLVAWHIFRFGYRSLLLGLPIIFLLVLIYSPEGLYFIIYKGPWFLTPAEENWKYGIYISIMFFVIQFLAVLIADGLQIPSEEDKEDNQELQRLENLHQKLQQINLNLSEEEKADEK